MRFERFLERLSCLAKIELVDQIRFFFESLLQPINLDMLQQIVEQIFSIRPELTNEHLAYLLFSAVQYVTNFKYGGTDFPIDAEEINRDFIQHHDLITSICIKQNVSTQCIARYAGLQIVAAILNRKDVTIIDLGAATGLGLMALNTELIRGIPTETRELKAYLDSDLSIGKLTGIETSSLSIDSPKWVEACALLLPRPVYHREIMYEQIHEAMRLGNRPEIIHADFLHIEELHPNLGCSADIVWTSNTLYQIGSTEERSIELLKPTLDFLLKPNGIWVDSYYRDWFQEFGSAENPYQIVARFNDDFAHAAQVLSSVDDGVPFINRGPHFSDFVSRCISSTISA